MEFMLDAIPPLPKAIVSSASAGNNQRKKASATAEADADGANSSDAGETLPSSSKRTGGAFLGMLEAYDGPMLDPEEAASAAAAARSFRASGSASSTKKGRSSSKQSKAVRSNRRKLGRDVELIDDGSHSVAGGEQEDDSADDHGDAGEDQDARLGKRRSKGKAAKSVGKRKTAPGSEEDQDEDGAGVGKQKTSRKQSQQVSRGAIHAFLQVGAGVSLSQALPSPLVTFSFARLRFWVVSVCAGARVSSSLNAITGDAFYVLLDAIFCSRVGVQLRVSVVRYSACCNNPLQFWNTREHQGNLCTV